MEDYIERDEADLAAVFRSIKKGYNNFLVALYSFLLFLLKFWYIVIILIGIGVAYGYYKKQQGASKYETTLVVKISQGSTDYLYEYIESIGSYYLESKGFAPYEILDMEIEAIPNFKDLLDNYENQNINLVEHLLENASADDILKAEFFRDSYTYHKIKVEFGFTYNGDSVQKLIDLLNSNERFKEVNAFHASFNKEKVAMYEKMIDQIDATIEKYNSTVPLAQTDLAISGINIRENNFVTSLIEYKSYVIRFLERAKLNAMMGDKNVFLTNTPVVKAKLGFIGPILLYPLLLLFLFFGIAYAIYLINKAKRLHEDRMSLKE